MLCLLSIFKIPFIRPHPTCYSQISTGWWTLTSTSKQRNKMYSNTPRRTGEGPMDFEWQQKGGPMDPKSPFLQFKPPQHDKMEIDNSESPNVVRSIKSHIHSNKITSILETYEFLFNKVFCASSSISKSSIHNTPQTTYSRPLLRSFRN